MAIYVFAGKVVRRGSGVLSNASVSAGTNSPYSPYITTATGGTLQVTLLWELPTTTVDGSPLAGGDALTSLEIYYSTTQANATVAAGTAITGITATDLSRVIGSLSAATAYWFAIRAVSAYGPSDLSNAVTATTS